MTLAIVFTGGTQPIDTATDYALRRWCANQPDVELIYTSIHADPVAAVRCGITHLPALVLGDALVVQGPSETWMADGMLRILTARMRAARRAG
jgi:hypothetical protein